MAGPPTALVHLGAGVGNIVLATPLLLALRELGFAVDLLLAADCPQTADLLRPSGKCGVTSRTIVLAPGCKTGVMAPKRWRYFDARPYTLDHYGRFCGVVLRAAHPLLRQ